MGHSLGPTYMLIRNNLLIELVDMDFLLAMRRLEHVDEVTQELFTVIFDIFLWIFADE